ncbi:Phospholipase/Carboxylesterase [Gimesia alba]|uniref:Phospholipase/Carboxylesterase n=1 Tax=Gimesia alba TaxID=2527973 RepID=A0A517R836_9PLAN|nr:hypothetical protein [Gimesia alba]QDT40032.1 Phospholipase/Carboxylesterase [Gimesia alba]
MQQLTRYAMFLTAFALLPTGFAFSEEANVLLKDSFEEGKTTPNGWNSGANLPGVRYVYDKGRGKTGKRSLSLQKTARRYFPIAQWYRILPYNGESKTLQVKCQVRAQQATKAIIDVQFLDANRSSLGHEWVSYIGAKQAGDSPANHNWKEYSGTVSIPDKTKQIAIALQIYGPGKIWFDDLEATFDGATPAAKKTTEKAIEVKAGKGVGQYLLVPPKAKSATEKEQALLIVLPGGDGSADFHPFVKRIHENALSDDFVLAQPLARQWSPSQKIVWPTVDSKTDDMQYTTEELIEAVIEDVSKKHKVNPRRIYLLAWSSGGPAAYATVMQKETQVNGALIAMSVFKPKQLPDPKNAKDRSIYMLHSPDDKICPYWMAQAAEKTLSKAGVSTTLVNYPGGHGWKGDVYGNIRQGIEWLQKSK